MSRCLRWKDPNPTNSPTALAHEVMSAWWPNARASGSVGPISYLGGAPGGDRRMFGSGSGAWIEVAGGMTLDGERADVEGVCAFLQSFWLPDEAVVYVGKATSLSKRLRQFWRHRLGERGPHAGGHWVKALRTLDELHVFFAEAESPAHSAALEAALVDRFVEGVSARTRAGLRNPGVAVPFANRSHPRGARKTTALRGQTVRS